MKPLFYFAELEGFLVSRYIQETVIHILKPFDKSDLSIMAQTQREKDENCSDCGRKLESPKKTHLVTQGENANHTRKRPSCPTWRPGEFSLTTVLL